MTRLPKLTKTQASMLRECAHWRNGFDWGDVLAEYRRLRAHWIERIEAARKREAKGGDK